MAVTDRRDHHVGIERQRGGRRQAMSDLGRRVGSIVKAPDESDPAIVAAAYLLARLTCDRFDDGPVECARTPPGTPNPASARS